MNVIRIQCDCGRQFEHRLDRWTVRCPFCARVERVEAVREQPLP